MIDARVVGIAFTDGATSVEAYKSYRLGIITVTSRPEWSPIEYVSLASAAHWRFLIVRDDCGLLFCRFGSCHIGLST